MTDRPSNFLNRKKRKPNPESNPKPQTLKELCDQRRRELKDDRWGVRFVLPDGQEGTAYGPTKERVVKALLADFPDAQVTETVPPLC